MSIRFWFGSVYLCLVFFGILVLVVLGSICFRSYLLPNIFENPFSTPSYVNLKSTTSMSLHGHVTMPTSASAGTAALTITLNSASLAVFATPALAAVAGAEFRSLLPWSLQTHKFPLLVLPGDIVRSYVVHAE